MKPCKIVQKFERVADGIFCLFFENEKTHVISRIRATGNHPFFVIDRGWIPNEDIKIGESCISQNGDAMILVSREYIRGKIKVYNFEVEGAHTYFVGTSADTAVLLHNKCAPDEATPPSSKIPDAKWKFENAKEILKELSGDSKDMRKLTAQLQWMLEKGKIFEVDGFKARYFEDGEWKEVLVYDGYQKIDGRLYLKRELGDLGAALILAHEGMHAMGFGEEKAYSLQMALLSEAMRKAKYSDEAKEAAKWAIEKGMLTEQYIDGKNVHLPDKDGIKKFLNTAKEYNWKDDGRQWKLDRDGERMIYPQHPFVVKSSK